MKKFISFILGITRISNFRRISSFQMVSQYIAGVASFSLTILGTYFFIHSIHTYFFPECCDHQEFYTLIKGILSSFELYFMAPIPFLIIFSHRRNISEVFSDIIPTQEKPTLNEVKAKKGFISSIIGILSTFILGVFFEAFSKNTKISSNLFEENFWYYLIMILMLFIFMGILIFYYKLLSNHEEIDR